MPDQTKLQGRCLFIAASVNVRCWLGERRLVERCNAVRVNMECRRSRESVQSQRNVALSVGHRFSGFKRIQADSIDIDIEIDIDIDCKNRAKHKVV